MSTTTPNLGLFKYNPETDGKETFSITTALNNNWDLIDSAIIQSGSSGESGYAKLNNGLIINYGQASISSQEVEWTTPKLVQNDVLGGNTYAVACDSAINGTAAYMAFDGVDGSYWLSGAGYPHWLTLYIPEKARITAFRYNGTSEGNYFSAGIVQASDDNSNWESLYTFSGIRAQITYNFSNDKFYKYYRLYGTTGDYTHAVICELVYYGTTMTTAINNITFPQAFTSTNYAYSLAYKNGVFGESYATNLTTTGMTLQNNSSADAVYYIAVGY